MKTGRYKGLPLPFRSGNDSVFSGYFTVLVRIILLAGLFMVSDRSMANPTDESDTQTALSRSSYYQEMLYHYFQGDYFTALIHLLAYSRQGRLPQSLPPLDVSMQFSFGVLPSLPAIDDLEGSLYKRNIPEEERNRFWFFLGKIYAQREWWQRAAIAFSKIDAPLEDETLEEERLLYRVMLLEKEGELEKAIELMESDQRLQGLGQYDLAMLYLKNHQTEKAILHLKNILSKKRRSRSDYLVGKTRINLARLYQKVGLTDNALEVLNQLPQRSQFYSEGLLLQAIAYHYSEESDQSYYMWKALSDRTDLNSGALKTWFALPYIWFRSDLLDQAADGFAMILEKIRREKRLLMRFSEKIDASKSWIDEITLDNSSRRMGWFWNPGKYPEGTPTLLQPAFAEHDMHEALSAYRDIDRIIKNLESWRNTLPVYSGILQQRLDQFQQNRNKVMESLQEIDFTNIDSRIKKLDEQLGVIYKKRSFQALMTENEEKQWSSIQALENALNHHPDMTQEKKSLSLIKGVFVWKQMQLLPDRYWRSEKLLREVREIQRENHSRLDSFPGLQKMVLQDFTVMSAGLVRYAEQLPILLEKAHSQKIYWKKWIASRVRSEIQRHVRWLDQQMADARLALLIIEDQYSGERE